MKIFPHHTDTLQERPDDVVTRDRCGPQVDERGAGWRSRTSLVTEPITQVNHLGSPGHTIASKMPGTGGSC